MAIGVRPGVTSRPVNFLRPCLLLLLDERPGHGYELSERLVPLAGAVPDTAVVYRALNAMEDEGLVSSQWERSTEGPVRRCHELTPEGRAALAAWAGQLADLDLLVGGLLELLAARGPLRAA
jgi:PadR family transcriptional regulator, regulatory protein PadR